MRCVSLRKEQRIMRPNLESSEDVTELLLNWQSGDDEESAAKLMPLVYEELRRAARSYLQRERGDHTLQATALVHEAYLQLVDDKKVTWKDRAHFYGVAARLMRQILMQQGQHARSSRSLALNAARLAGVCSAPPPVAGRAASCSQPTRAFLWRGAESRRARPRRTNPAIRHVLAPLELPGGGPGFTEI